MRPRGSPGTRGVAHECCGPVSTTPAREASLGFTRGLLSSSQSKSPFSPLSWEESWELLHFLNVTLTAASWAELALHRVCALPKSEAPSFCCALRLLFPVLIFCPPQP